MPNLAQRVDTLLGGVSQQPPPLRDTSQVESQTNLMSSTARGLCKRPPVVHVAKLTSTTTGWDSSAVHEMHRADGEKFHVAISNGGIKVYDADGVEQTVISPNGTDYLAEPGDFRMLTIDDTVVVVNRGVTVAAGTEEAAAMVGYNALVYVRSGNFKTKYSVSLIGQTATYTTVDATDVNSADQTRPEYIAEQLMTALSALGTGMSFTRYGNVIHIFSASEFDVSSQDGLENNGLLVIKDRVSSFTDLPTQAPADYTVAVQGNPESEFDDYYVIFDSDTKAWRETVKPRAPIGLDATTMPHRLKHNGAYIEGLETVGDRLPAIQVEYDTGTSASLIFDPVKKYPKGAIITAYVEVNTFVHTVVADTETGASVATALTALIDAHASYAATSPSAGVVSITLTPGPGGPIILYGLYEYDKTRYCYIPGAALTASAHVGRKVINKTSGAYATITANTPEVIEIAAGTLTGGTRDTFEGGDEIEIAELGDYFMFDQAPWKDRETGDLNTNPWPSMVGRTISSVFFTQNRLGFTCGDKVVLSEAAGHYNLFRTSVLSLIASDPIDIGSAHPVSAKFHSAVEWDRGALLQSDVAQFHLNGDPVLSPATVRLDLLSQYPNANTCSPLPAGGKVYLTQKRSGATTVLAYEAPRDFPPTAENVTEHVPTYVSGSPLQMAGDASLGFLAVLTDSDRSVLYVYFYRHREDGVRVQSAWSKWQLPAGSSIRSMSMADGVLTLIVKRADGVYLETLDVGEVSTASEKTRYLDRRLEGTSTGVSLLVAGGNSTYTLPFSVATNGSEGTIVVIRRDTGASLTVTRPAANQATVPGDMTGVSVYIGIRYTAQAVLSKLYMRDQNGRPEQRGRLIVRFVDVHYADTTDLKALVTADGRAQKTYTLAVSSPQDSVLHVPVQTHNETLVMELTDSTPGGFSLSGLDWEAFYHTRARRMW